MKKLLIYVLIGSLVGTAYNTWCTLQGAKSINRGRVVDMWETQFTSNNRRYVSVNIAVQGIDKYGIRRCVVWKRVDPSYRSLYIEKSEVFKHKVLPMEESILDNIGIIYSEPETINAEPL